MFIVFVLYNKLKVYSYLHMNSCILSLQMMNFITTPSWKMSETFELPTKHDMLQNIVHVYKAPTPLINLMNWTSLLQNLNKCKLGNSLL
jgi:hypothetical protein